MTAFPSIRILLNDDETRVRELVTKVALPILIELLSKTNRETRLSALRTLLDVAQIKVDIVKAAIPIIVNF